MNPVVEALAIIFAIVLYGCMPAYAVRLWLAGEITCMPRTHLYAAFIGSIELMALIVWFIMFLFVFSRAHTSKMWMANFEIESLALFYLGCIMFFTPDSCWLIDLYFYRTICFTLMASLFKFHPAFAPQCRAGSHQQDHTVLLEEVQASQV